jgi:tyrosine-protein phosphatase YwqE
MFFKKKEAPLHDFSVLGTDLHSHLLPGIDDGSQDMETSVRLVKGMGQLGFKKLITTPHIMWDMYKNTNNIIFEKLDELRARLKTEEIDVEIDAAAEYFIDDYVENLLKQKEPLLSFGNKFVLVEFSMASAPFDLKDVLFEMQLQGYQPVIAHPERYIYLEKSKNFYAELRDIGCLFQLNALSLSGYYGHSVMELASYLCKKQYYDLVGSDLHHSRHLNALQNPTVLPSLKKLLDTNRIQNQSL